MSTWLCNEHRQEIRKICIFRQQCMDRRLCRECILSHHNQINEKNILSPEKKRPKYFKEYDNTGFLKIVESLEDKLSAEFEKIENQIKFVKEFIKQDDKPILDLKDQLTKMHLSEFSKEDYNYMRDILEKTQSIRSQIIKFFGQS